MTNNSANSIRTAIATHLAAVTELKSVVIGRSFDPSAGFPYCRIYLVGVSNQAYDNQPKDYRSYRFAIDIFQEVTAQAKPEAEADFEDAIDAVMDKLAQKWQLPDGSSIATADNTVIGSSFVIQTEPPFGPSVYLSLLLEVKTLIY